MTETYMPHPFTMDGHQDAIYYAAAHGGTAAFDAGWEGAQLDLPNLRAGEVDASFWAIFGVGEMLDEHEPAACADEVDELMARYLAWVGGNPEYRLILDASDLRSTAAAGGEAAFGVLLHCEGARGIAGPEHLGALHEAGLRSLGLTWNRSNAYATGVFGDPGEALTPEGFALVRELNSLRMVIDGAHLNRRGLWNVLETSTSPVIVTHTACAALCPNPRNLEDDQIGAVAASGGLIGVFYANDFLAPHGTPVTLDTLVAHYDHLLEVAGPEHVALGTDYGGIGEGLPPGLEQVGNLPRLYTAIAERGYSAETIAALRGGNYLRVLGEILG
ncbi:MAG: dipeptidase [Chloroflexia bacterium]